jgi:hypothetical protein
MKTDLDALSRAYRKHLEATGQGAGSPCPRFERLVSCVWGKVTPQERTEIISHIADCAVCATAIKEVLALAEETDTAAAGLEADARRRMPLASRAATALRTRPALRWAAAGLAGVVVIALLAVSIPRLLERPAARGGGEASIALVFPRPGETAKDGLVFKWKARAGVELYTVEVFDKSFRLVWRSGRLAGTEAPLPAEAARLLAPGESYYWRVKAAANGEDIVVSKLAVFSVGR